VVLHACSRTGVVTATGLLAIGVALGANEVWDGLRVIGGIGRESVRAYAGVGEGRGITRVRISGCRVTSGLQADERTFGYLGVAPGLPRCERY